jgi:hypothetical protein
MRGRHDRDRLAILTFEQAGEEIAFGEPWVTDASAGYLA